MIMLINKEPLILGIDGKPIAEIEFEKDVFGVCMYLVWHGESKIAKARILGDEIELNVCISLIVTDIECTEKLDLYNDIIKAVYLYLKNKIES